MKTVFGIGLESSGNNWIRSCISQHPELSVSGTSYPGDGGVSRRYSEIPNCDVLMVIARDLTIHKLSVKHRDYNHDNEGKFSDEESISRIVDVIKGHSNIVFVSYETVLIFKQVYFNYIFKLIGVRPVEIKTEYRDENKKYLKA